MRKAPLDDEPETSEEREAMVRAREDVESGRVRSTEMLPIGTYQAAGVGFNIARLEQSLRELPKDARILVVDSISRPGIENVSQEATGDGRGSSIVENTVYQIIADYYDCEPSDVSEHAETRDLLDFGWDSLAKVEVAIAIEDEFEIDIPDEDISNFGTPAKIAEYVQKRLSTKMALAAGPLFIIDEASELPDGIFEKISAATNGIMAPCEPSMPTGKEAESSSSSEETTETSTEKK